MRSPTLPALLLLLSAPVACDTAPSGLGPDPAVEPVHTVVVRPSNGSEPLRFVVLGDGGTGDEAQKKVAAAVARVCQERGCEFALYLGDNIYETGVSGVDDEQFKLKFEDPYQALDFPFYVALGNHDYGSFGSNAMPEDARSAAQVEYTAHSAKWVMPYYYYAVEAGQAAFFALDTNAIVLNQFRGRAEQQRWLDEALAMSEAPWKLVFGHHPYISNGHQGNAGE